MRLDLGDATYNIREEYTEYRTTMRAFHKDEPILPFLEWFIKECTDDQFRHGGDNYKEKQ